MSNPTPPTPASPGSPVKMQHPQEWFRDMVYYIFQSTHAPYEAYYKELFHNSTQTIWTPDAGNQIHMRSFYLSVEDAGVLEIYRQTDTTSSVMFKTLFANKSTIPYCCAADIELEKDEVVKARFVGDTGTPTGYITLVGHEHRE